MVADVAGSGANLGPVSGWAVVKVAARVDPLAQLLVAVPDFRDRVDHSPEDQANLPCLPHRLDYHQDHHCTPTTTAKIQRQTISNRHY